MSKKIYIPILLAVVAAGAIGLLVVNSAFAKEGGILNRFKRANGVLGRVSAIKTNEFTVTRRDGSEMSFLVTDETKFLDRDRNELTSDDIVVGGWVLVAAPGKSGDKLTARVVVILPEDFDPENMAGYRGTIAGVNISANEFTLKTKNEQEVTIAVDENTNYKGEAADLADLETGMGAGVTAEKQSDGSLLAQGVRSSYPLARKIGQVTAIDQAAGTFTLKGRDGIETTFVVNAETRFRSKNGKVNSLADLTEGMVGAVVAVNDPAFSNPLAKMVVAADKQDLPKVNVRFAGKVTAVDSKSFTIQTRNGKTITFQVTSDTRFRSRDGSVKSLADLKEGMIVGVGAKDLGNDEYQAQVVVAGKSRNP
jgi:hypothetical protein